MDTHTQYDGVRDQSSEEYRRVLSGIDNLQLNDGAASDNGRKEENRSEIDYTRLYRELLAKAFHPKRKTKNCLARVGISRPSEKMHGRIYALDRLHLYEHSITMMPSTSSNSLETNTPQAHAFVSSGKLKFLSEPRSGLQNEHSRTGSALKNVKRLQ